MNFFRHSVLSILRIIGARIPNIKYVRAISNLILKPLNELFGVKTPLLANVFGFKMFLDPRECVDSGLLFSPHLYDKLELDYLLTKCSSKSIVLDVGSNIGYWALRFAERFPSAKIIAIEANPETYEVLCKNIEINNFKVSALHIGVSNQPGYLFLQRNLSGNRGGDKLLPHQGAGAKVTVDSLLNILSANRLARVDIMKMDIEGLEKEVLNCFFQEAPKALWPQYLCVEILHDLEIERMLVEFGYTKLLIGRDNIIFGSNYASL